MGCQLMAYQMCDVCAEPVCTDCDEGGCSGAAGSCFEGNGSAGCSDTACCESVCAAQPECCEVSWDANCAATAASNCDIPENSACVASEGSCFEAGWSPGCDQTECCNLVCAQDDFCCDNTWEWDATCVSLAASQCEPPEEEPVDPCEGAGGNCFVGNGSPGCTDAQCCADVCESAPYCCGVAWDEGCSALATQICVPDSGYTGSCCAANDSPGCDDATCASIICSGNPDCCEGSWNGGCAALANIYSGLYCGSCL